MRRLSCNLAVLALLVGPAFANSAPTATDGSRSGAPQAAAALRTLERGVRAVRAVEVRLSDFESYDPAAVGSEGVRQRFFEAVLECGRAERALRTAAGQTAAAGGDPLRRFWEASESMTRFTSSVRWLHRSVVARADVGPALERVRDRAEGARVSLELARAGLTFAPSRVPQQSNAK